MKKIVSYFILSSCLWAAGTEVLFEPSMTVGPFPTDALTAVNFAQQSGLQVNFPIPSNCGQPVLSACTNDALLNQLDGFSTNPMIVVCFSGAINPQTLANGISIYPLSGFGPAIGIDQILYDPPSSCMYAKPLLSKIARRQMAEVGSGGGRGGTCARLSLGFSQNQIQPTEIPP